MAKIATAAILLCLLAAAAHAGPAPSGLCPPGDAEAFNVNGPGCTLCYEPTGCQLSCIGPPQCFCPPGDSACCFDNPCCQGCPDPKPLRCETSTCDCAPETCCSTVCPAPAPAPTSSAFGLAGLAAVLLAIGAGAVRIASGRRSAA